MNVRNTLRNLTQIFSDAGFDSPDIEAAYIVSEATGIRHNLLYLHAEENISEAAEDVIRNFVSRRLKQEPFQYIFGWTEFRELRLDVGPGCLIPRPETEVLTEHILKNLPRGAYVCEVGIGSGAVSLSLAYERPDVFVWGSEISEDAFRWASQNREKNNIKNVQFVLGDMLTPFVNMKFHAIAANLPYIPFSERENLPQNVREYEPQTALFADDGGTALMKRLISDAPVYLRENGMLYLETGEEQGMNLGEFAIQTGQYQSARVVKDQYGADRFLFCQKK